MPGGSLSSYAAWLVFLMRSKGKMEPRELVIPEQCGALRDGNDRPCILDLMHDGPHERMEDDR